ncbi:exocyst complex component SEC8 isoform X2 [Physcomitrium patens]|uniref:Exocyst complex component Sec8 n=1 Tax=Physcomitrium patens TaxID=3218 RepID=A0A7I4DBM1_PHYPA|nr:exocyst complex component SEC8-like isoform X2 [Physcomitrium patens]|eukprot:XP_024372095.1 exocyst complex component SEC8-like isoform X2 [Physcomitrella patens]
MAANPAGALDWDLVKVQLDSIDDAWKQPRFDSLPYVVEVITSPNIEASVERLRETRDAIEEIVDGVVRHYHNGFNKAIHNYSQILRVFSESAGSLDSLKEDLAEARKLLGARHKQLQQQWSRSVTLRHVISLLDEIDKVSQVPARIERLAAEKRYYAAVQLHLQSISMLDREGIQTVGALQDVRAELTKLRGVLFSKVVEDLHLHLYNRGDYSMNLATTHEQDDDITSIVPAAVPAVGNLQPVSRRTRTLTRNPSSISSVERRRTSSDSQSVENEFATACDNADGSTDDIRVSSNASDDSAAKEADEKARSHPPWLSESIPNDFTEALLKSDAPSGVKYLQTMVECLSLLRKIPEGGSIISQRLRPTLHELITSEIKARAKAIEACRPRVDEAQKLLESSIMGKYSTSGQKKVKKEISSTADAGPMSKLQTAAQELLQSVLTLVLQILENHVVVGQLMEAKEHSFLTSNGHASWSNDVESEVQQLICDILRATPDATSAESAAQTARLASKTPITNFKNPFGVKNKEESNGGSEEGLSFAFRFTDTILTPPGQTELKSSGSLRRGHNRKRLPASQDGYGTGAVLSERGIYLTSAIYRPILQFIDKMASLLPPKYSSLTNDGLQNFIEKFVKNQFLPIVHVDYRTRVADALASPSAFRLKAHPGALYEDSVEKGRPVLQGPIAANHLVTEVLGWAQAMPKYASEILELVQTLLDRTLERCRAVYTEAVLGSLSSTVIGRPDICNLMKQEPANQLLEATYLNQLGFKDGPSVDIEGALEVEMELNNLLLSLRPIRKEQLISDHHKLVLLAGLSDSLDFVSESVQQLGQHNNAAPSPAPSMSRRNLTQSPQIRHRRTNSALTTGLGILAEKYRMLSCECLQTLRVEMQLATIHHLQSMAGRHYVRDQDAEEPEDFIVALTSQIQRVAEEMAAYMPPSKRSYIFGGICSVSAAAFIKAVTNMDAINMLGVRQVNRNCIALQQALASLVASSGEFLEERLDRVRTYYDLLTIPFEALIALVPENDAIFSLTEYSALLKVNVPGREIPANAVQRVAKILAPTR